MPVANEAMKKIFRLPEYDKVPVILSCAGGEAAALLSTKTYGFVFEMSESFAIPNEAEINVSLRDAEEVIMHFCIIDRVILQVGDMIEAPAKIYIGCDVRPVKSEPILLKGDGDNPDILIV